MRKLIEAEFPRDGIIGEEYGTRNEGRMRRVVDGTMVARGVTVALQRAWMQLSTHLILRCERAQRASLEGRTCRSAGLPRLQLSPSAPSADNGSHSPG